MAIQNIEEDNNEDVLEIDVYFLHKYICDIHCVLFTQVNCVSVYFLHRVCKSYKNVYFLHEVCNDYY